MRRVRVGILLATALVIVPVVRVGAQSPGDSALRVLISLQRRRLFVLDSAGDTLLTAPAAVGSGKTLSSVLRWWRFRTPKGETKVIGREKDPVWIPPDWHYVELAKGMKLKLDHLTYEKPVTLRDGRMLAVRNDRAGLLGADGTFAALPVDEELIFDRTLFIPPFGTDNRRVKNTLGPYRLLLANGVGIHGTALKESVGRAVTHGCIRLYDEDITWLYEHVPVGTRVLIY